MVIFNSKLLVHQRVSDGTMYDFFILQDPLPMVNIWIKQNPVKHVNMNKGDSLVLVQPISIVIDPIDILMTFQAWIRWIPCDKKHPSTPRG